MTSICHSLSLHDALPISVLSSMFAATEPHIALPAARPPWNIVVYVARDLAPTHLGLALYIETFRVATTIIHAIPPANITPNKKIKSLDDASKIMTAANRMVAPKKCHSTEIFSLR